MFHWQLHTIRTSNTFNANIKFTTISWMSMSSIMTWLIGLSWIWTDKAIAYFYKAEDKQNKMEKNKAINLPD